MQQERLSAYMDGHNINGEFTDTLCQDADLQKKWASYHTIRSVMRGEEIILASDFSDTFAELLENEEIEKSQRGRLLKLKRWSVPIMQVGIAASVCLAVVISVNNFSNKQNIVQNATPVLQTLPFSNSVQQVSYNAPSQNQPTEEQLEYQQRRINALIQNHELERRTEINNVILSEQEKQKKQTSAVETPATK